MSPSTLTVNTTDIEHDSKYFYFSVEVFAKITSIFYVMTSHRL
jgi:hypothetical protein